MLITERYSKFGLSGCWHPAAHSAGRGRKSISSMRPAASRLPSPQPGLGHWNVMAWEKVAPDLARDAGVIVPRSELIRVGDRHARQRRHPHDGR